MNKKGSKSKKERKPWPTKDAMEQIYEMNLWGSNETDFYSGIGSHHPEFVQPYLDAVRSFLNSFNRPISVCDLGCGDFNIGKELVKHTKKYVAVDIVPNLIERNKEKFKIDNLKFHCFNIAEADLPVADCALLRHVLQHLSNDEVQNIVTKLVDYKYVILTEHLPKGSFEPNKDIISGQGIRLKKQSGLDLLAPPFKYKVKEDKELLSISLDNHEGLIVTTLYEVF